MVDPIDQVRKHRDTQTLILQTALQLFAERGYFNTSVHDIRHAAGLSIGSIYHHFAGKEAIARSLYDYLLAWMGTIFDEIMATHHTAHDRFRAVTGQLFQLTEEDPTLIRFILHARHQEFLPTVVPVCSSLPFQKLRLMVEESAMAGELVAADPIVIVSCLLGGPLRMIHLRLDGILERPLPHYLEETWRLSWGAVARP